MAICKVNPDISQNTLNFLNLVNSLIFLIIVIFFFGCGNSWHGQVVYLLDGKVVIQSKDTDKIKPGQKIRIYRQKTITHPVTNLVLDDITDNIGEFPVTWISNGILTTHVPEPEFSMIMIDDETISTVGSGKPLSGSVYQIGKVTELVSKQKAVQFKANSIDSQGTLTVISYKDTIISPSSGEILALVVEPVAELKIKNTDAQGRFTAIYNLLDEKLGWVEIDDIIVKRTGDMASEKFWFQKLPDGFQESWMYNRNYLRSIRLYYSGLYREAILELEEIMKFDPEYKDVSYLLGACYENINKPEDAIAQYKKILEKHPDEVKALISLGYLYINKDSLKEAMEVYESLTSIIPENSLLWTDLGDIYNKLGDVQKAQRAYRKALETDKDNKDAVYEIKILE